jgi:hypothetical protein
MQQTTYKGKLVYILNKSSNQVIYSENKDLSNTKQTSLSNFLKYSNDNKKSNKNVLIPIIKEKKEITNIVEKPKEEIKQTIIDTDVKLNTENNITTEEEYI